jgi:Mg2+-importing ATPase
MTKPDAENTVEVLVNAADRVGAKPAEPPVRPAKPPSPTNAKTENIHVSPAVLDAARKDGEELLRDLRTSLGGLTQAEALERARMTGPNEVAQERKQGWPVRVLKIIRNPLLILLTTLSAVFFLKPITDNGAFHSASASRWSALRLRQKRRQIRCL